MFACRPHNRRSALGWAFGLLGGEEIQEVLGWVCGVPLGAVKGISEVAVDQLSELEAANQQGAQRNRTPKTTQG
jgi:hypothetical protein